MMWWWPRCAGIVGIPLDGFGAVRVGKGAEPMAAQNLHAVQRLFLTREKRLNLFWRIFLFLIGFFILDVVSEALGSVIADRLGWQSDYAQFLSALFSVPLILGYTLLFRLRVDKRSSKGLALTPLR